MRRNFWMAGIILALVFELIPTAAAQQADRETIDLSPVLRWRNIGPMRGGRTRSAAGHPAHPFTFYIGAVNGGVWKTEDAGRTWRPIFDDQPTQSIGALVIAPSDPDILYVGSGEGLPRPDLSVGDGIYRSVDGGRSWTHLGLREAQQIAAIAVDPGDPDRLFVAALGHPYGPNAQRGVYRSTDGGETFVPVLQINEDTGGNDVDIDPVDPDVVYANMWEQRQGPWENAAWSGLHGGLFKSVDGGETWTRLTNGLPERLNQVNLAIAPSRPSRLYAVVGAERVGIYRSDDAGASWNKITEDRRPARRIGGGDLPVPIVDPTDPDTLIMGSVVAFKSTDGGRSWVPFKGAPGGEDYQGGWINPERPGIILMVADQGGVVTLNGGKTWSSWYNQSTAQLYHVAADNAFPYRVYSGQQESGSAGVASRGNYGAISVRDWLPVGVDEYGYAAPDPLDPDIVYGGRRVTRFDRRTGQVSDVNPVGGWRRLIGPPGEFRVVRTQPVVFSQADPHALYYGNNFLWKTTDGGIHWRRVSPDLTRRSYELPESIGTYADPSLVRQRGVIYTIGPSPIDPNRLWIGTDDGIIATTNDGGTHWTDVTPPMIGPWWKVFMIDAGRFDKRTAYAAVNTLRIDDMHPHFYRTHDGGETWTEIVSGLEEAGPANSIREDPQRPGLLFASTERGVFYSLNDGDRWRSLRLNLPATSVRDLIVKDDDLVVATHGRGFWILDDITPLRQIGVRTAAQDLVLFQPPVAWRVRWNMSPDMPWPKEEPTCENPPEGAGITYYLGRPAAETLRLEVWTRDGRLVRRYASDDPVGKIPDEQQAPVPRYWYRPPQRLSTAAGLHRFHWDLHYQPLHATSGRRGLPITAIPGNTAPRPTTPWVTPGVYTVRLLAGSRVRETTIKVKLDPRVTTPAFALRENDLLTESIYFSAVEAHRALAQAKMLREAIVAIEDRASGPLATELAEFDAEVGSLRGDLPRPDASPPVDSLLGVAGRLAALTNLLQRADVPATAIQSQALQLAGETARRVLEAWRRLSGPRLDAINVKLRAAGLPLLGKP